MSTIWSFDLGKASIGEAVREVNKPQFLHKASLLVPADFARRGPLDKSGTPASRYRAWVTRCHRRERERWLDMLWRAADLPPLQKRVLSDEGGQWHRVTKADPRLEDEAMNGGGEDCRTSCVLRIALLGEGNLIAGGTMSDWQIYKALFSSVQKRGVGDVPWKERRVNDQDGDASENNAGSEKWQEFLRDPAMRQLPDIADPSVSYRRPCYYDAWRMKLWNPAEPAIVNCKAVERPQSTRGVAFPAEVIEREIIDLARAGARLLPQLDDGDSGTTTTTAAEVTIDGPDSTDYIWYFDGAIPANYPVVNNATATVTPSGLSISTYYWLYDGGPYKIDDPRTTATVKVESTGKSSYSDDCSLGIHVTLGDGTVLTPDDAAFTVDFCADAPMSGESTSSNYLTYWQTTSTFVCQSQFGSTMTAAIELNENFGAYTQVYPGCTWSQPPAGTDMQSADALTDHITPPTSRYPVPVAPVADVDKWPGYWDVGSESPNTGTTAFRATWHRFTTYAEHDNVTGY